MIGLEMSAWASQRTPSATSSPPTHQARRWPSEPRSSTSTMVAPPLPKPWLAGQKPHSFLNEECIANGQGLVNDEDICIDVSNHRKGETYGHAGRVGLDRLIDEIADIRKGRDLVKAIGHVLAAIGDFINQPIK